MNTVKMAIVMPVYNDWESVELLIPKIDQVLKNSYVTVEMILVNDASIDKVNMADNTYDDLEVIKKIEIIHLTCNMGHQRGIAVGLTQIFSNKKEMDVVVVMDSDGEDRPEDILNLLGQYRENPDHIIVASRIKRSEGILFRFGYSIYKLIFRIFTGKKIMFGNFCLIPIANLSRLVYLDSLWNHLSATILRSKLNIKMVPTERGVRLRGNAKMNFGSLVLHGLSAVSVYIDVMLLRTLSISLFFGGVTFAGIILVSVIRFFTELAIPGWASNVVGSLTIILILSLLLSIFALFTILANRSQLTVIPAKHISDYIKDIEIIIEK